MTRQDKRLPPELPISASLSQGGEAQIFAPWFAGLPEAQRDLLSLLPVVDVNGAVISALEGRARAGAQARVFAALLCADPFLRVRDASELLRAAGIGGVANFPTIQVIDGAAARGFDSADLGFQREAEVLGRFAAEGLEVLGFATSAENGLQLIRHGASALVVHPGPASTDWRARAIAARGAEGTLAELSGQCTVPLWLYCPPAYGAELDGARALAAGLVRQG